MLRELLNKLEILIEKIRVYDPLMIFPWHRKLKLKWERQNINDDIKKLIKSKRRRRKQSGRN